MDIRIALRGKKKVSAHFDQFEIISDQPESSGGEGSAPSPFDYFVASIGTCAGFFVQSFCQARHIPTDGIEIIQTMVRDEKTHLVSSLHLAIRLPASFPEKYREGVITAVNACSVKKHLVQPPQVTVETTIATS